MPTAPDRDRDRDRDAEGRAENQRPRDRFGRPLAYDTTETELAQDWEYGTVEEALTIGRGLWDDERYFEAHECLEDVWHNAPDADRRFWQGVIQVAVGCCHHQRGRHAGAIATFAKAAEKLGEYPDLHHGVDVEQLRVFCEGAIAAMREADTAVEIGYPEFPSMDDGPWFTRDGGPTALPEGRDWEVATRRRQTTAQAEVRAAASDGGSDPAAS